MMKLWMKAIWINVCRFGLSLSEFLQGLAWLICFFLVASLSFGGVIFCGWLLSKILTAGVFIFICCFIGGFAVFYFVCSAIIGAYQKIKETKEELERDQR